MACIKQDTCGNYPRMCKECFRRSLAGSFDSFPCFVKIVKANVKFKIFFGTIVENASDRLNQWLAENPNVRVLDYQYQQARYGDHSICIRYEEVW